jgi:hypothetical protein
MRVHDVCVCVGTVQAGGGVWFDAPQAPAAAACGGRGGGAGQHGSSRGGRDDAGGAATRSSLGRHTRGGGWQHSMVPLLLYPRALAACMVCCSAHCTTVGMMTCLELLVAPFVVASLLLGAPRTRAVSNPLPLPANVPPPPPHTQSTFLTTLLSTPPRPPRPPCAAADHGPPGHTQGGTCAQPPGHNTTGAAEGRLRVFGCALPLR